MQAGKLRHLVTFDSPSQTSQDDTTGEEIIDWGSGYATVYAAVEPLTGREFVQANAVEADIDTRITVRWEPWLDTVNPKWRIRFRDVIYNIQSVANVDMRDRELQFMCKSGVNSG
jgi:SPP1 family predicted phage head-tail adaptor